MRFCYTCNDVYPNQGHHVCPIKHTAAARLDSAIAIKMMMEPSEDEEDEAEEANKIKAGFVKYDQAKAIYSLVPWETEEAIAAVLTFGARKYTDDNWKLCKTPWRTYYSALRRHLSAASRGERIDADSGEPHLAHALCCLSFLHWFLVNGLLVDAPCGPTEGVGSKGAPF